MTKPLPPGTCNAHCHVFGPRKRFPYAPDAPFVPEHDAPREALYALNDRLGLTRCVIVQSACHGTDNSVTADAVAGRRQDYRGIALVRPDIADAELRRLATPRAFAACASTSWAISARGRRSRRC
jgi:2-pyrone-4,6-dicarboxylate lactonase